MGLLGQRLDQMRMRMAEARHGDAGAEIEVLLALFRIEAHAFAMIEGEGGAIVGGQDRRDHRAPPNEFAAPWAAVALIAPLI